MTDSTDILDKAKEKGYIIVEEANMEHVRIANAFHDYCREKRIPFARITTYVIQKADVSIDVGTLEYEKAELFHEKAVEKEMIDRIKLLTGEFWEPGKIYEAFVGEILQLSKIDTVYAEGVMTGLLKLVKDIISRDV